MSDDGAADMPDAVRIGDLAAGIPPGRLRAVVGDASTPVSGVTHDSRAVAPGVLFACVVGTQHDGHAFAAAAVDAGCVGAPRRT